MRYCERCGTGHECESDVQAAADREVAIEKLRTTRDIEVARINASAGVQVAETEAEHATQHAEGVVEGIETVLDAVSGETAPDGDAVPEGEPIVVETAPEAEPEPELDAPPPPEVVTETSSRNGKGGYWGAYR
jgi:hypothetical protein